MEAEVGLAGPVQAEDVLPVGGAAVARFCRRRPRLPPVQHCVEGDGGTARSSCLGGFHVDQLCCLLQGWRKKQLKVVTNEK